MAIGPVEYLIVGFAGNEFNGEIVPALAKLIDNGTIRILDLMFITKDAEGSIAAGECDELGNLSAFAGLHGEVDGFIGPEDIEHVAEALEPATSVALLVWENLWAAPFVEALRDSGGVLLEGARIPHDLVEAALAGIVGQLTPTE